MSKKVPAWLPALEKWENAEYDGIKGSPPEWVPQPYKEKFLSARNTLFRMTMEKNGDYQEVKSRLDELVTKKYYRIVQALMKEKNVSVYDESLFILTDLFKVVSLGPDKGLLELSGEDGLLGFQRRKNLKNYGKERAKDIQNERTPEWEKWKQEADCLIKMNPHLAKNKTELARRIKDRLQLTDAVNTIRQRI